MGKTNFTAHPLSRRSLLRLIGAAGVLGIGGTALAGCSAPDAVESSGSGSGTTVTVVTYNGNPPYCYLDSDGNLVGYDVEVLRAVDEHLDDYTFNIDSMDFNTMITACEAGSADLVSCQLVPNEDRRSKFIFCEEPFCLSPMVFAVADPNLKTLADMAGHTVMLSPTSYEYGMIESYNEANPDQAVEIVTASSSTLADQFRMVASGQVDSTLVYDGSFDMVNEEAQTGLYKTDVAICESTYFMFNEAQTELRDAVDEALRAMKEDGSLAKISEEILGTDVFSTYADVLSDNELKA